MTKIKIGADELILWLHKNGKKTTPNNILGMKIKRLIEEKLDGKEIEKNVPVIWQTSDNECDLPKTASLYEIDTEKLGKIFDELLKWE